MAALGLYTRLQREFPDCGMKMVVVGDGPMMNSLRSEFPDAVFCGMRRGEDLARHYAAMDVLLFASETETFGNVLLEGMASGLATVRIGKFIVKQRIGKSTVAVVGCPRLGL